MLGCSAWIGDVVERRKADADAEAADAAEVGAGLLEADMSVDCLGATLSSPLFFPNPNSVRFLFLPLFSAPVFDLSASEDCANLADPAGPATSSPAGVVRI